MRRARTTVSKGNLASHSRTRSSHSPKTQSAGMSAPGAGTPTAASPPSASRLLKKKTRRRIREWLESPPWRDRRELDEIQTRLDEIQTVINTPAPSVFKKEPASTSKGKSWRQPDRESRGITHRVGVVQLAAVEEVLEHQNLSEEKGDPSKEQKGRKATTSVRGCLSRNTTCLNDCAQTARSALTRGRMAGYLSSCSLMKFLDSSGLYTTWRNKNGPSASSRASDKHGPTHPVVLEQVLLDLTAVKRDVHGDPSPRRLAVVRQRQRRHPITMTGSARIGTVMRRPALATRRGPSQLPPQHGKRVPVQLREGRIRPQSGVKTHGNCQRVPFVQHEDVGLHLSRYGY